MNTLAAQGILLMETRNQLSDTMTLLAVFALTVAGCGPAAHELDTAPVSGRVTLDGQALPQGIVYVLPSKGRMAKGLIRENGSFELTTYDKGDGAQVGSHPAIVTALPSDELDAGQKKMGVPVPKRYTQARTSGLTVDVQAGKNNEVEWALLSKDSNQ
jgi:hypothetical protein